VRVIIFSDRCSRHDWVANISKGGNEDDAKLSQAATTGNQIWGAKLDPTEGQERKKRRIRAVNDQ
jgi:hypothetical protein